jgi:hypothetical protein
MKRAAIIDTRKRFIEFGRSQCGTRVIAKNMRDKPKELAMMCKLVAAK